MSSIERAKLIQSLDREIRHFIVRSLLFNQKVADEVGLNATDLQCLHIVELLDGATPSQIAKQTNLTTGGVTVMLDRLEKSGYIKREPNPDDRRSIIVRAQEERLQKLYTIYKSKQEMIEDILSHKKDEELETITNFFSEIRKKESEQ